MWLDGILKNGVAIATDKSVAIPYFTAGAPMSNKRPPPFFGEKSCVGLIALELAPTVNYWFKG